MINPRISRIRAGAGALKSRAAQFDRALQSYFDAAARQPLLTREQEIVISQEIETRTWKLAQVLFSNPIGRSALRQAVESLTVRKVIEMTRAEKPASELTTREVQQLLIRTQELMRKISRNPSRALNIINKMNLKNTFVYDLAGEVVVETKKSTESLDLRGFMEQLQSEIKDVGEARNEFVNANLRLVVTIAKEYRWSGLDLIELIQEGNLGLMRAALGFNWRLGNKFSTYATWWIRAQFERAIAERRIVQIPQGVHDRLGRLTRIIREHELKGTNYPLEAAAAETGIPPGAAEELIGKAGKHLSLDSPAFEEGFGKPLDFVEDTSAVNPLDSAAAADQRRQTAAALNKLGSREKQILCLRFGIGVARELTLAEVGAVLGVSRERVRQLESIALRKLRTSGAAGALRTFLL